MIVEESINNNAGIYSYSDNENYQPSRFTDHDTTDRQHSSNIEIAIACYSNNLTPCPSYGIPHREIESDGIPESHTKKYQ